MTHASQKHIAVSAATLSTERLVFFKKVHKASSTSNRLELKEVVLRAKRDSEKVNALNWIESAQEQKGKTNSLWTEKKKSLSPKKGAISCDWRRGQMGCGSAEWRVDAEHEAEATDGLKSMRKNKIKEVTHDKQKHPDTNQIKATFHQFARFWLHLSQFWIQASSSMCWKDSKTQTFISFAKRKKAFRSC